MIDWISFLIVAAVALVSACAVVSLYALALRMLSTAGKAPHVTPAEFTDAITIVTPAEAAAEAKRIDPPALWERNPPVRYRKSVPDSWIALTITEGRNRQVRRMTAAVGFPTLRLVRWQIGDWTLEGLDPGAWRDVTPPRRPPQSPLNRSPAPPKGRTRRPS